MITTYSPLQLPLSPFVPPPTQKQMPAANHEYWRYYKQDACMRALLPKFLLPIQDGMMTGITKWRLKADQYLTQYPQV